MTIRRVARISSFIFSALDTPFHYSLTDLETPRFTRKPHTMTAIMTARDERPVRLFGSDTIKRILHCLLARTPSCFCLVHQLRRAGETI